MRALEFRNFGDLSELHLVERPDLRATEFSAIVRVEAASINPSDVKNIAGKMHQTTLPRIPGRDYAGVVVEGPADWVGVPVWGTGGDVGFTRDGTHAEYIEAPRSSLVRKPAALSFEQAAGLPLTFVTAWIGLMDYARLAKGETVAVIRAGGVGGAVVQLAKFRGARVIAINRGPLPAGSPAERLADEQVDSTNEDAFRAVRADVVYDTVGGKMFESAVEMLRHRGRLVEISPGQDPHVNFNMQQFYRNESQLFGVDSLKRDLTASAAILRALEPGFDAGAYVAPLISRVLPLEKACEGYELVEQGQPGRVVLRP